MKRIGVIPSALHGHGKAIISVHLISGTRFNYRSNFFLPNPNTARKILPYIALSPCPSDLSLCVLLGHSSPSPPVLWMEDSQLLRPGDNSAAVWALQGYRDAKAWSYSCCKYSREERSGTVDPIINSEPLIVNATAPNWTGISLGHPRTNMILWKNFTALPVKLVEMDPSD